VSEDSRRKHSGESNWAYNKRRNSPRGGKDPSCFPFLLLMISAVVAAAALMIAGLT